MSDFEWTMADHVCRVCFSRVVKRKMFNGMMVYRCTGCGVEREGKSASVICACGMKLRTGVDLGIRCKRNPDPTPECPLEIIAEQSQSP